MDFPKGTRFKDGVDPKTGEKIKIAILPDGEEIKFEDVDVITTATKGLMSGILGILSFRLTPPKTLRKFMEVSINGIPSFPGPCPNEYLGIVDLIIYGTEISKKFQ